MTIVTDVKCMKQESQVCCVPVFSLIMREVLLIVLLVYSSHLSHGDQYVPGSPGAAWSQEELLIVRAKLWKLFTNNWVYKLAESFEQFDLPPPDLDNDLGFFPAKVLRLRCYKSL